MNELIINLHKRDVKKLKRVINRNEDTIFK